jgi:hypothetical protein
MSVRSLTDRLKEETREAHRRLDYALLPDRDSALPKRALSVLPVQPRTPKESDASAGVRVPKPENRWNIPGGIAARFALPREDRQDVPASAIPESPPTSPEARDSDALDTHLQPRLSDFILRTQSASRQDENLVENVELVFQSGETDLLEALLPGWPDPLPISPTAGHYPVPGVKWLCTVDSDGFVYPLKQMKR